MKKILFVLTFLILSLDFKSSGSIKAAAEGIVAVFIVLMFLSVWAAGFFVRVNSRVRQTLILLCLFFVASIFVAIKESTQIDRYFGVATPFYLLFFGYILVLVYSGKGIRLNDFLGVVYTGCVLSLVWTVIFGAVFEGVSIGDARYQIVSQSINFLMAYLFYWFVHVRTADVKKTIVFFAVCLVFLLSLTRGLIAPVMFMAGAYFVFYKRLPGDRLLRDLKGLSVSVPLILIVFSLASVLRPDIYDAWIGRLFDQRDTGGGQDLTYLTRVSEYRAQINAVTDSISSFLFGKGIGATYNWDFSYFSDVSRAITYEEFTRDYWFAGHSLWVYSFFSGGITWGLIIPIVMIRSIVALVRLLPSISYKDERWMLLYGILSCVGVSFTTNPLAFRYSAFVLGVYLACTDLYARNK